jgi:hypothetical protein
MLLAIPSRPRRRMVAVTSDAVHTQHQPLVWDSDIQLEIWCRRECYMQRGDCGDRFARHA